jgi:hypothetical protein
MRKILASDYNEDSFNSENMRPDITPPCNKAIFDNIRIDDYHLPPQSLEHTPCYNSIIISKTFSPLVRRELGGERRDEPFRAWFKKGIFRVTGYDKFDHHCHDDQNEN